MKNLENFKVVEINNSEIKRITGGGIFDDLLDSIEEHGIVGPFVYAYETGYAIGQALATK